MDIFESIENMRKSYEELEKRLSICKFDQSYIEVAKFDPKNSPLAKQADLLQEIVSNTKVIESQALELKRIADSAEKNAALAEEEAKSAKKDAVFSKIISVLALLVSAGSLVTTIIALAMR